MAYNVASALLFLGSNQCSGLNRVIQILIVEVDDNRRLLRASLHYGDLWGLICQFVSRLIAVGLFDLIDELGKRPCNPSRATLDVVHH